MCRGQFKAWQASAAQGSAQAAAPVQPTPTAVSRQEQAVQPTAFGAHLQRRNVLSAPESTTPSPTVQPTAFGAHLLGKQEAPHLGKQEAPQAGPTATGAHWLAKQQEQRDAQQQGDR